MKNYILPVNKTMLSDKKFCMRTYLMLQKMEDNDGCIKIAPTDEMASLLNLTREQYKVRKKYLLNNNYIFEKNKCFYVNKMFESVLINEDCLEKLCSFKKPRNVVDHSKYIKIYSYLCRLFKNGQCMEDDRVRYFRKDILIALGFYNLKNGKIIPFGGCSGSNYDLIKDTFCELSSQNLIFDCWNKEKYVDSDGFIKNIHTLNINLSYVEINNRIEIRSIANTPRKIEIDRVSPYGGVCTEHKGEKKFFKTAKEVAEYFDLSSPTIARLCKDRTEFNTQYKKFKDSFALGLKCAYLNDLSEEEKKQYVAI